jgi:hypothetical protein
LFLFFRRESASFLKKRSKKLLCLCGLAHMSLRNHDEFGGVMGQDGLSERAAASAHYLDLRQHVDAAYALLCHASENSAPLPNDVLVAITTARDSLVRKHAFANVEEETRFWNAYSLLYSNKLADTARRKYRLWLYVVLACLLVGQIYYVAGSLVVGSLTQVEDEWQGTAPMSSKAPNTTAAPVNAEAPTQQAVWQTLRRFGTSQANYYLGVKLLPLFAVVKVPDELIPHGTDPVKANFMANYMKLRAELQLILLSLSGYILPLLYGTLGAFAYVLRKLSDPLGKLNFAVDTWSTYTSGRSAGLPSAGSSMAARRSRASARCRRWRWLLPRAMAASCCSPCWTRWWARSPHRRARNPA